MFSYCATAYSTIQHMTVITQSLCETVISLNNYSAHNVTSVNSKHNIYAMFAIAITISCYNWKHHSDNNFGNVRPLMWTICYSQMARWQVKSVDFIIPATKYLVSDSKPCAVISTSRSTRSHLSSHECHAYYGDASGSVLTSSRAIIHTTYHWKTVLPCNHYKNMYYLEVKAHIC